MIDKASGAAAVVRSASSVHTRRIPIKKWLKNLLTYIILIAAAVVFLFPFVWMVSGSFKDGLEVVKMPPQLLPSEWKFSNYVQIEHYFPIF